MAFPSWFHADRPVFRRGAAFGAVLVFAGCQTKPVPAPPVVPHVVGPLAPAPAPPPGPVVRHDDEIIVAGRRFHTGTRVVTWMDPGGYDAYQPIPPAKPPARKPVQPRAGAKVAIPPVAAPGKSYGAREITTASGQSQPVHHGDLTTLQSLVDEFVLHYDGNGVSSGCFTTLRQRGLSVHFLLDVDGTIYQTLDLEERALHATIANDRSIGVEIANVGAHLPSDARVLDEWYRRDASGRTLLAVPKRMGDPRIRTKDFEARPVRDARIRGEVQGHLLEQYDFTAEQYVALSKLTAALCRAFPRLACDYPRDRAGQVIPHKLPDDVLARYHGVLGHFHVQTNKQDPGPALQWDKVIDGARMLLK